MRIAIEALGIHRYGGGRSATINLFQSLFALDQQNEYLIFLSQHEPKLEAPNVRQHIVNIRDRFAVRLWAQFGIPRLVRDCDIVHFAKNLGVFGLQQRTIVTVYDMTTLIFPELSTKLDVWYWKHIEKLTLRGADHIIAISHQTAYDIQKFYDLPREQISVIYPACGRHFQPVSDSEIGRIVKTYELTEDYILHVGRIDPKKNIPLLIEAFSYFRHDNDYRGQLLLIGEQYEKKPDNQIYTKIEQLELNDSVFLLGIVTDRELPAFYSGSTITVVPSAHEGFGLTALEALSCGAPLIVNKAGAINEVVGDAAIVMPESTPECLASLMTELWLNKARRSELSQRALKQASVFSWEETAQQTLELYQRVYK
jgi:glycosyltransferase involved in cell wall biosynthesis